MVIVNPASKRKMIPSRKTSIAHVYDVVIFRCDSSHYLKKIVN